MNKYILPGIIILGIATIIVYFQINNGTDQNSKNTSKTTNFKKLNSPSATLTTASVTLPTGEDIIRTFFNLINEKRVSKAIGMMNKEMIGDESGKQAWEIQFNNINSAIPKIIDSYSKNEWTENEQIYKVVLDIKMSPESEKASIPYYGWDDGENTRWIVIKKDGNLWKISSISTGP